jgi:hypothetical protein
MAAPDPAPDAAASHATAAMTLDDAVRADIWSWLRTFVTVNNAFYNGKFAPCPYARKAIRDGMVDVHVHAGGDVRSFIRARSIELRDDPSLSTRVMAFAPRIQFQWGITDFVEALNAELIADNVFLNTGVTKTMPSCHPGAPANAPYFIVVANRLDAVLDGSRALQRTAFYNDWPRDQYELVVNRRDRLAARYAKT